MRQGYLFKTSFCFLKSLITGKSKWPTAWFHYIWIEIKYNKNKLCKTLDYTRFRSKHAILKSRRKFSQVVQVKLWTFARPC